MPYPETMVSPMRAELRDAGFEELVTPEDVDRFFDGQAGTSMLVFNSVCGCAAGMARPGIIRALAQGPRPDQLGTVFAGQEVEATQRARDRFPELPPSSPSLVLTRRGELVEYIPRHRIENRDAGQIAEELVGWLERMSE